MWIAHDRQPGCSPSIETASYATNSSDSSFAPRSNGPAPAALRRVLRRTRDGVALNVDGAAVALTARGDDLADLCTSAGRVREAGLPLPFVHQSSPPYLAGAARPGPTHRDNRAVHALARIMLHGRISNIPPTQNAA
ncbi:MAG: synthase [Mycobacterium sp.]|jgi:hypothetical protein|nr:synthase [Mycobacterium sp.]